MQQIELRKSQPSEVDFAVPLIYSSGPASFEYVFKNSKVTALDFLRYAYMKKGGEFSYDNHYSAYLDEEMIGIASIFDAKRASSFTVSDAINIILFYGLKSIPVLSRGLQVEQIIKLPKGNEISLAHVGIDPDYRGKGYGTTLIKKLLKTITSETSYTLVLDVSVENPRAKALYDRLGFVTTITNISKLNNKYSYVADHERMELVITS